MGCILKYVLSKAVAPLYIGCPVAQLRQLLHVTLLWHGLYIVIDFNYSNENGNYVTLTFLLTVVILRAYTYK